MAWYPGAQRLELQPESDAQPSIRPTQLIVHSIVAPWTARRTYEYWRDSTNLESHFGIGYAGDIAQYIGTQTRADANAQANRRPDGTGAVSVETASNTEATDPWTPEQVEELIRLGVWVHEHHGVPLRICRTHSDPGFGYHRLHSQWSLGGTACPGPARIKQFREVVFPAVVARASGQSSSEENEMQLDDQVDLGAWVPGRWPGDAGLADGKLSVNTALGSGYAHARRAAENSEATLALVKAQGAAIGELARALAAHHETVDADALVARIEAAIEGITVRLDVTQEV